MLKPRIGISLCLLGYRVRYDGSSKFDRTLHGALGQEVEWVGICPEVECGLGIPREPIRLEGDLRNPRLRSAMSHKDLSQRMECTAKRLVQELRRKGICGFIFKSRSPSCGLNDTPIYNSGTVTAGLFARAVTKAFPGMPVADEIALGSESARKMFLKALGDYRKSAGCEMRQKIKRAAPAEFLLPSAQ